MMSLGTRAVTVRRSQGAGGNTVPALAAGYSLALAGTVWDDLEHQGVLEFGAGFAHLVIYVGFAILLVALVALLRTGGRWLSAEDDSRPPGRVAAVAGIVVLLAGIVVDLIWHGMNPDASEENMLALPGHAIQHVGLIVGLLGSGVALFQIRHARTAVPEADR